MLPNIDDGPTTIDESIEMAKLLVNAGYDTVYCTPHLIKGLYEADNNTVKTAVSDLQNALNQEKIALQLLCGREYFLDSNFMKFMSDLMPLENTRYLLIEFPPHTYPGMVQDTFSALIRKNLIPMIAHPERSELFHEQQSTAQPKKLSKLKTFFHLPHLNDQSSFTPGKRDNKLLTWLIDHHCAFQQNLPSLLGTYGEQAQATAENFKRLGIYTHSGTDAHSPEGLIKLFGQHEP
ncbi:MAG TPA: hypothetical protein ENL07_07730 [Chlorobaculum parvum]|uniref:protein-tyrosine-phosphatase n=1 Tax=Chlorobaculum parvum TaxID=274539 RepID=A0A7C5HI62_9CHLB|nr:hypothetical protein [Chlorobaculum parvum]